MWGKSLLGRALRLSHVESWKESKVPLQVSYFQLRSHAYGAQNNQPGSTGAIFSFLTRHGGITARFSEKVQGVLLNSSFVEYFSLEGVEW